MAKLIYKDVKFGAPLRIAMASSAFLVACDASAGGEGAGLMMLLVPPVIVLSMPVWWLLLKLQALLSSKLGFNQLRWVRWIWMMISLPIAVMSTWAGLDWAIEFFTQLQRQPPA